MNDQREITHQNVVHAEVDPTETDQNAPGYCYEQANKHGILQQKRNN